MKEFYIDYLKINVSEDDWKKFLVKQIIPERIIRTVLNIECGNGMIRSDIIYSEKESYLISQTRISIPVENLKKSFVRKFKIRHILKND